MAARLLIALAALAMLVRLGIYVAIQFPAPVADGILFASVASYACREGSFATPLFPLDPSGHYRYLWHAIGQPALLAAMDVGCSPGGLFGALAIVVALSTAGAFLAVRKSAGSPLALLFALSVFALQVKQGWRPETLAIALVLLGEHLRLGRKGNGWVLVLLLLAWVHPTACVLQAAYVACTGSRSQWRQLATGAGRWLPLALALTALLIWAYPFPIAELLAGLATQGRLFAQRSDGSLVTEYLRSDFFPLFGVAFAVAFGLVLRRHRWLALMLPLLWFYAVRVPVAYYNAVPLFVALLHRLALEPAPAPTTPVGVAGLGGRAAPFTVAVAGLLAWVGIVQGDLRDLHSHATFHATLDRAQAVYQEIVAQGAVVCRVPPHFTLFLPSAAFRPDYDSRLRDCDGPDRAPGQVDLVAAAVANPVTAPAGCVPWPAASRPATPLDSAFRRDSGYAFSVCPHRPAN